MSTSPFPTPLRIMVSVFTGAERSGWVNPKLMDALLRLAYDPRLEVHYAPIHAVHPIAAARNMCVEKRFLDGPCELLVMLDNDIAPPPEIAEAILTMPREAYIGVLPCWIWSPEHMQARVCFGRWSDGFMQPPNPAQIVDGWQQMGAGGTGCIFIRKRVFDLLPRPFFKSAFDDSGSLVVGEDIYFTGCAAEEGFPTWVNPNFPCSHFHTIDLAEVNAGAAQAVNRVLTKLGVNQ